MTRIAKSSAWLVLIVGVLFSAFATVFSGVVEAQQAQSFRGLIIDEIFIDFDNDPDYGARSLNPGESVSGEFTIQHNYAPNADGSVFDLTVFTRFVNFVQSDQDGVPQFLEDGTVPFTSSLADWITLEREEIYFSEQNQKETIRFTVDVPIDAEPGGKYAAILFGNNTGSDSLEQFRNSGTPGLGINSELGPLMFLTVNGETSKKLVLENLYTRNIKGNETSFFTNPPVEIVAEFSNSGNVHAVPRGVIHIHKGGIENINNALATIQFNPDGGVVLPDSTRAYTVVWGDNTAEEPEGEDYGGRRSFILSEAVQIRGNEAEGIRLEPGDDEYENYGELETVFKTNYNFDHLSKIRIGQYTATIMYDYQQIDNTNANTVTESVSFTVFPWQVVLIIAIPVFLLLMFIYYKVRQARNK